MSLLNFITKRKSSTIFNKFLQAWFKLRDKNHPVPYLETISDCILSEHASDMDECINYYIENKIDRAILHLYSLAPEVVENFYLKILQVFEAEYLNSEFYRIVWKHGNFEGLALRYAELCVGHGIFNHEFGHFLMQNLFVSNIRKCILIVGKVYAYKEYFKKEELGQIVGGNISRLLQVRSRKAFGLLNLLACYEDLFCTQYIDEVNLVDIMRSRNGNDGECGGKMIVFYDAKETCGEDCYENTLLYLKEMFSAVKSKTIRIKIVKLSLTYIGDMEYVEFIGGCIVCDPVLMASLLSESKKGSDWNPFEVYGLLWGMERECGKDVNQASLRYALLKVFWESSFDSVRIEQFICKALRIGKYWVNNFNFLEHFINKKFQDLGFYVFLLLVAPDTFYNNIFDIMRIIDKKDELIEIIELSLIT